MLLLIYTVALSRNKWFCDESIRIDYLADVPVASSFYLFTRFAHVVLPEQYPACYPFVRN